MISRLQSYSRGRCLKGLNTTTIHLRYCFYRFFDEDDADYVFKLDYWKLTMISDLPNYIVNAKVCYS
jgi:hypothetical protein